MEVIGNGVDIVENSRIKKLIKNIKFLKRIYSVHEINKSKYIKNKVNFFAKRFAAKEAFVKSLGTGFRSGINFSDIKQLPYRGGFFEFIDEKIYMEIHHLLNFMLVT